MGKSHRRCSDIHRTMPRLSLLALRLCRVWRLSVSVLLGIIVFGHRVRVIPWVAQSFFGHGIVAADTKRLATKDPIHGKDHPHKKSPLGKRLQRVFRTGRGEAAGRASLKRRQNLLIKADQPNAQIFHCVRSDENMSNFANPRRSSRSTSVAFTCRIPSRGLITTRYPFFSSGSTAR